MRRTATDLEPFRVPAFRRYLVAATAMSISHWVYTTALVWTVLDVSGSAAVVALVSAFMTLPLPFAALPGGMLTDRLGPRDLMVLALLAEALCIGATGLLAATGTLTVPLALALTLMFGIADGVFVVPAGVVVGRIVPPHVMASAIGTSMLSIGVGRIAGGVLGGVLVAGLGAQGAMVPGALGVVLAALIVRSLPRVAGVGGGARLRLGDLADGVRRLRDTPGARALLVLGAISALFLWPYTAMVALVVTELLHGGAEDLGLLTAASGAGAILAAVTMGFIGRRLGRGRQLVVVLVAAGAFEVVLGVSASLPITLLAVTVLATMTVTHSATSSLLAQAIVPVAMRGRALAIYGFVFFGCLPVGYLATGVAADAFGVAAVLVALGIATAGSSLALAVLDRRSLRLDVPGPPAESAEAASVVVPSADPVPVLAQRR